MTSKSLTERLAELCANDAQLRAALSDRSVSEILARPGVGLATIVPTVMAAYAERPAIAQRATTIDTDTATGRATARLLPNFDTLSYADLWRRVCAVAAVLANGSGPNLRPGQRAATHGFASVDYTIVDLALAHLGVVAVPLSTNAPVAHLIPIVAETKPTALFCSIEHLDAAIELAVGSATVQRVIVFDYLEQVDDQREALEVARARIAQADTRIVVDTLIDVVAHGSGTAPEAFFSPEDREDLRVIMYTSGSTGAPKGAMVSERLVANSWCASVRAARLSQVDIPSIVLSCLPMSHVAGRAAVYAALGSGGTVYFGAASDLSTLLDDIALVRPTKMTFVPRIWEIIRDRVDAEAARLCGDGADRTDLERATAPELRRQFIGDRCLSATTGSAPIAPALKAWLESFLGLHVADTLGSTETGAILVDGRVRRPPVLDYRLSDIPELGYFGTDRPYPRGELLVRTDDLIAGYYGRPELTAAMCDEDGFYRTGDVVAEIAPDHLQFVDRRNGVLKLAQGEFVQVAQLEGIFTRSPWISQCYVYGSGARSYLLAVVVPTADALREVGGDTGELKHLLAESIRELARQNGLQSYELPRDFIVETEPFTRDNGLLTGIGKLARPAVKQAYEAALEKRYDELTSGLTAALLTLRADAADAPVLETVQRAAQALLGVFDTEVRPDAHFSDLGGDSMSALVFSDTLSDAFGVDVPVDVIVSPATDLRSLAAYVDRLRGSGQTRPTHRSVHGADTTTVHARDLVLDKFIDEATLSRVPQAQVRQGRPTTVLLTGATGFLGRYLALEWLSRIEDAGDGHLICLVRADDESSARQRLENAFGSGSSAMLERFRQLAAGRLEIVVGDKSEPDLGVEACEWRRLADTVDLIVDSAAMVNHVLPYGQLFGPNVAGTAELIRLALNGIRKPYAYVSTIGVGAGIEPSLFTEDADIRTIGATRALDDGYANGYAASKWAGEVLLREAHDAFALPVAVFRCNMILADSSYPGQLNVSDVFTRTIASLAATGVAPESFYEGGRQRAHYDGLPVEFVARAISALSSSIEVFQTYHVINPHDDGVGLDEFVDWLVEAGCPVTRISDYARWLERFETSLRALPAHQRAVSLLPLLHHYRRPLSPRSPGWIAERFRAATREAGIASDIPGLSRAVIAKYVDDLRLLGLLPAP